MRTPTPAPTPPTPRTAVLWALAPIAAFAYGLAFSWRRWGEIVVDWGRELEIARRLAAGDLLYLDVAYWYGPLAPYANALAFTVFGVHTVVLQTAGLASATAMAALLWALARRLAGAVAAAVVTSAFVSLCAFGHYYVNDIFNWATPYAYPATYGMVLATASLYALVRSLDRPGNGWFIGSLVCLGLTAVTKLEPAFAIALAHAAFCATTLVRGQRRLVPLLAAYGAVLVGVAAVASAFGMRAAGGDTDATMLSLVNPRSLAPILRYMGVSEWQTGLEATGASALRFALCLATPLLLARLTARHEGAARWVASAICIAVAIGAFLHASPEEALRAVPLLVLLGTADALVRFWRRPAERAAAQTDLILWGFGLGALARLSLAAGAHHYGFYLLPVPLAAVLLLWFRRLPTLVAERDTAAALCRCTAVALVATLAWTHTRASAAMYRLHTARVVTARGDLWLIDDVGGVPIGQTYAAAVARLGECPSGTTVFAAPEGAGLAFLAGRPSWGRSLSYYPPETGPEVDTRLRRALEADPPAVMLLTNVIDLSHYGAQGFGRDYATTSMAWLQQHYVLDRTFTGNAIVIARPRDPATPSGAPPGPAPSPGARPSP